MWVSEGRGQIEDAGDLTSDCCSRRLKGLVFLRFAQHVGGAAESRDVRPKRGKKWASCDTRNQKGKRMAELTEQDRDRIRTITEREWVATCSAGDWDAAAALCTEDVDYMPADLPWLRGREAVAGFLRDFPEFSGFHQEVVKISGDSSLRRTRDVRDRLSGRGSDAEWRRQGARDRI